ncbi:MAG: hypothetical protein JW742_07565, partial [Candidatus Aminicenantes bacterium]|nr:hypothetical protein [Candidatus Aminicenantes bacterium]
MIGCSSKPTEEAAPEAASEATGEDLRGKADSWTDKRGDPAGAIPEGARAKALEHKARMEPAVGRRETSIEKADEDVLGRARAWYVQRSYPAKRIPLGARRRAVERKANMRSLKPAAVPAASLHSPPSPGICNWTSAGPRNINGRIRSLAVHPTNGDTIYAGAAEGGVWRSTNAGQSWIPLMQYEMSLAVGALAIDPTNPDVLYAGTGEPTWWPGYEGVGVLKSVDGGLTWANTGAIGNGHIARLAIDPSNTQIVYCAGFDGGLYKTTNGGGSWTLAKAGDVTDFVLDPTTPTTQYLGIRNDGVYGSTDGAATWTKLAGGLPASASNRVMLSLSASAPSTVYAKLDETVYKTTDGGTTWT